MSKETLVYTKSHRNYFIDLIRGLSILAVMLLHINLLIPFDHCYLGKQLPQTVSNILFHSGYYGVMIFFVISGFLITNISLKRWGDLTKLSIPQFYQIRFARIAPCLIVLVVILSVMHNLGVQGFVIKTTTLEKALFSALTFHLNWLEAKTGYLPGCWDVLWSLSVEEAFYIFFPLLCVFVSNQRAFKLIMLIFIILGPLARCAFSDNDIWSDHSYLSCIDGIMIGCLAAFYINKYKISHRAAIGFLISGLLLFIATFIFRHQVYQLGLSKIGVNVSLLEIGIACILIATGENCIQFRQIKNKLINVFLWYGKNSYEIYLTHMFIVIIVARLFLDMHVSINVMPAFYLCILLLSGIIGNGVAKYFSEPLNQYLRLKFSNIRNIEYNKITFQKD